MAEWGDNWGRAGPTLPNHWCTACPSSSATHLHPCLLLHGSAHWFVCSSVYSVNTCWPLSCAGNGDQQDLSLWVGKQVPRAERTQRSCPRKDGTCYLGCSRLL
jgi:hypothetical protein